MKALHEEILNIVTEFYLTSSDYNGFPASWLAETFEKGQIESALKKLIKDEMMLINFGDRHPNPHILALEPEDIQKELSKFAEYDWTSACLYPTRQVLSKKVSGTELIDRPFTRSLRLGDPKLSVRFFDLSVLEIYRNDPRFNYVVNDVSGRIFVKDDFYKNLGMQSEDKTLLETFGFGYSRDLQTRVVVVFICYLSRLTSKHQQIWKANELIGDYFVHPDYSRISRGYTQERVSIFVAFTEELRQLNKLAAHMGRSPFLRQDFCETDRPKKFAFLLRPTLQEYQYFVLELDKMLSENINRDFFQNEVSYENEVQESDGKIRREPLNTITILQNWIDKHFPQKNQQSMQSIITTLRRVRRERQEPAHKVIHDTFNMGLISQQRQLIQEAFQAVRTLRLIMMYHPNAVGYAPPEWLQKSSFWIY